MTYISTRGSAPALEFSDVLLAGLALDGGLYVPQAWPEMSAGDIRALQGQPYSVVALDIMSRFVGDAVPRDELKVMVDEAYATFVHPAVAPLVQLDTNEWVLELFHGPTLAFKDVAMQIVSRLMDRELGKRGQRATVVAATSGDTGGAAVEAFRGRDAIDIFVLHPHGRVSDVQRKQMTSAHEPNVFNIAIEGNFDDCQALVKALFNDHDLRSRVSLAGVNSINWARIMAQTVYFFTSALSLGAPDRKVSFSVPTGNFGDIFAGYVARQMGLPIDQLVIATNVNDILARTIDTGRHEALGVTPSSSPSMDIQISSNFERMLFDVTARDADRINLLMNSLKQSGSFSLEQAEWNSLVSLYSAKRVDEAETVQTIAQTYEQGDYLLDPHTAVGVAAARACRRSSEVPMVTLATAHPAKFPDTVLKAINMPPPQPKRLQAAFEKDEKFDVLANDYEAVASFVSRNSRAAQGQST